MEKYMWMPLLFGLMIRCVRGGWSGGAKVCILHHRGIKLILTYSWARPAILVAGKGRFWFVLRFYGPVNPMGSCRARSVYQTTHLLGRMLSISGKGRRGMFYFFCFFTFIPVPLSSPFLSSLLLSLFSLSRGDDTKWPTQVDVSLNPNTINQ